MMNRVICLLFISLAFPAAIAQSVTPTEAQPSHLPSTAILPAAYPVFTIKGLCSAGTKKTTACQTVVTRAEFEKLANALNPQMTKFERRQLADTYAHILALSQAALAHGLDKSPVVQERLRYARLRTLAAEMASEIYRENTRPVDQDVVAYYNAHKSSFDRYTLQRIFIPREKQGESSNGEEAAMKSLADSVYVRASAGESFSKLQQEVTAAAGLSNDVTVDMSEVTRSALPEGHRGVLDSAQGSIAPLLSDETGYYIYRVVSRQTPSFEAVKQQASVAVQSQKQSEALNKLDKAAKTEVNESYFDKYDPPAASQPEVETEDD